MPVMYFRVADVIWWHALLHPEVIKHQDAGKEDTRLTLVLHVKSSASLAATTALAFCNLEVLHPAEINGCFLVYLM